MEYQSTRDTGLRKSAAEVIAQGISGEGGLFVPVSLPDLSGELESLRSLDYAALARRIFALFLTDFTPEEIDDCVRLAYAPEKFGGGEPVRLVTLGEGENAPELLELWHGPTCAFKDMALQILPRFLTRAMAKTAPDRTAVILTATSGDTGKAALEGFRDVPGTRIIVFYPEDGVSAMQKRQMITQEGENVSVCAVRGNFDDAQTAVKSIFTDPAMQAELARRGMMFSSANSINWGRLLPQIVYYFYAYFGLLRKGRLSRAGEKFDVCVPTGNFGNILAAYYARCMGLPVRRLICASNSNRVLADFLSTGVYDRNRPFVTTMSPSMDILISSNLERLLFTLCGEDAARLRGWMEQLSAEGRYTVDGELLARAREVFSGGWCDEQATAETIRETFARRGYLLDPHTAVAVRVFEEHAAAHGSIPTVIASTASPFKFSASVLRALGRPVPEDEFATAAALSALSGWQAPAQLTALRDKPVRFTAVIDRQDAAAFVRNGGC